MYCKFNKSMACEGINFKHGLHYSLPEPTLSNSNIKIKKMTDKTYPNCKYCIRKYNVLFLQKTKTKHQLEYPLVLN